MLPHKTKVKHTSLIFSHYIHLTFLPKGGMKHLKIHSNSLKMHYLFTCYNFPKHFIHNGLSFISLSILQAGEKVKDIDGIMGTASPTLETNNLAFPDSGSYGQFPVF